MRLACVTYLLDASFFGIVSAKKLGKFANVIVACLPIGYGFTKYSNFFCSLTKLLWRLRKSEATCLLKPLLFSSAHL